MKIGDILNSAKQADAVKVQKLGEAQAANQALADASTAADAADGKLASKLKGLGAPLVDTSVAPPVVYTSPDGVAVHATPAVGLDADVPDDAPPTPTPAQNATT